MQNGQDLFYKDILTDTWLDSSTPHACIFSSPNDFGVRLNHGRAGTRFGPQAILHWFGKFNNHLNNSFFYHQKLPCSNTENKNLDENQIKDSASIQNTLNTLKHYPNLPLVHLGGGHDHIFPLVHALDNFYKKPITILNLDAHLDTRVGTTNSGTPFRNIDMNCSSPVTLIQYGIHAVSNSGSTMSTLNNINQKVITFDNVVKNTNNFQLFDPVLSEILNKIPEESILILSLDCDAIDGAIFKGVSAVNGWGLPTTYVAWILEEIKRLKVEKKCLGIYEYNPIYDDLSSYGAKFISHLINQFLV